MKSIKTLLENARVEYLSDGISKETMDDDPMAEFEKWLRLAIKHEGSNANVMILSTVNPMKCPNSRAVLLKTTEVLGIKGFGFYTSYASDKGFEMTHNRMVALNFTWMRLFKQIRIKGEVVRFDENGEYFATRPRGSQIAARISEQSRYVMNRNELLLKFKIEEMRYQGETVPCPKNWGGYFIIPHEIDFWQGRENRLHDRVVYKQDSKTGTWTKYTVQP